MSETETKDLQVVQEKGVIKTNGHGLDLQTMDDMWRFSTMIVKSGFAPKGMEKPESCMVAIQLGMEIGLPPMQAIQNIAVINGRPTVWGDSAKALVEASGLCEMFNERFEGTTAVCEVKRIGRAPVRQEFSEADAKRAGLWGKQGPWTFYPKRMLQMRARSFAIRDAFPDVLKGLSIREEVIDIPAEVIETEQTKQYPSSLDKATEALKTRNQTPPPSKEQPFEPETQETHNHDIQMTHSEPISDNYEALMESVARLSENMAAAEFDKVCGKVAKDTAPQFMSAAQLELLIKHLEGTPNAK